MGLTSRNKKLDEGNKSLTTIDDMSRKNARLIGCNAAIAVALISHYGRLAELLSGGLNYDVECKLKLHQIARAHIVCIHEKL